MTDLDALDRLAAAATPGPWASGGDEVYAEEPYAVICRMLADWGDPDAAYIVALVNAAPSLIAELRAARKVVAVARVVCGGWFDDIKDERDMRALLLALRAALLEVPE